jgi:hypothetical protein
MSLIHSHKILSFKNELLLRLLLAIVLEISSLKQKSKEYKSITTIKNREKQDT